MERGVIGFALFGVMVVLILTNSRPAPKIDNAAPATTSLPRFHLWRGDSDADRTLDIKDTDGGPRGRIIMRDGVYYDPHGTKLQTTVTDDIYCFNPGYDWGTFAGYRNASRGVANLNPFTSGIRFSPIRVAYCLAPDLVLGTEWAGAGASFYLPEHIAGPTWCHLGVGFWYGIPFHGPSSAPAGWTAGLCYSIR
jgi:hypothetical protein